MRGGGWVSLMGFAILLGFDLLGNACEYGLHVPLPGNVIGLILFTAALFLRWIRLEWVEPAAQFLLSHMLLFFAPLIVGLIAVYPLLRGELWQIAVSLVLSTLLGLAAAGWVTGRLEREEEPS